MKKYVYFLMLLCFSLAFINSFDKNETEMVFDDNLVNSYIITTNQGISFLEYKEIFKDIDENNYAIYDFKLEDEFYDRLDKEISNIVINKGNYLDSLNEYITSYIKILKDYDKEDLIATVQGGNIRIKKIYIDSIYEVYNNIMYKINSLGLN